MSFRRKRFNRFRCVFTGWIKDVAPAFAAAYLLFGVLFHFTIVSGNSMAPGLKDGSLILIQHSFFTLERGDIVVCRPANYGAAIVKRVIGTAGETLDIDVETGEILVDGAPLPEPYVMEMIDRDHRQGFPLTVEEGHIFLLGDNRNNSADSRSPIIGQVSSRDVTGKYLFTVFCQE